VTGCEDANEPGDNNFDHFTCVSYDDDSIHHFYEPFVVTTAATDAVG